MIPFWLKGEGEGGTTFQVILLSFLEYKIVEVASPINWFNYTGYNYDLLGGWEISVGGHAQSQGGGGGQSCVWGGSHSPFPVEPSLI